MGRDVNGTRTKLALGTVQFGLPYGVANVHGQPDEDIVRAILDHAARSGVRFLDTASLYGVSEKVLGRSIAPNVSFDIVTKTPKFYGMTPQAAAALLRETFHRSLERLACPKVYGLLVHDCEDLLGPVGEVLWQEMKSLQMEGKVEKIGGSLYTPEQADALLERFSPGLVQVPLSILDQRLIEGGQLSRLSGHCVEIHARSVFLQGAILMKPENLPKHLAGLGPYLDSVAAVAVRHGMDVKTVALQFVAGLPEVGAIVCGVDTLAQFDELAGVFGRPANYLPEQECRLCACYNAQLINPALWRAT